jgi:outer membrane protein, heavy metal efflux system
LKAVFISPILLLACQSHAQNPLTPEAALRRAAESRPALKAARQRIEQARASARALKSFEPAVFSLGASSRSELGSTDQDLAITVPIDVFGRGPASGRLGDAAVDVARAEYLAVAAELQHEVLSAFVESVALVRQKAVTDELAGIAESVLSISKRRFDAGTAPEIQVTRASIEFERARQAAEFQGAQLAASRERLAGSLGLESSALVLPEAADLDLKGSVAVRTRPDLLNLQAQERVAEAKIRVARSSGRPELSLQLLRSPWSRDAGYFAGRVQLSWPLFDHGRAGSEARSARLEADALRNDLADRTARIESEVLATEVSRRAQQARLDRFQSLLADARTLVDKAKTAYAEGYGTLVDVLEASRALRELESEAVEARRQLSIAIIDQYRATGSLAEVLR